MDPNRGETSCCRLPVSEKEAPLHPHPLNESTHPYFSWLIPPLGGSVAEKSPVQWDFFTERTRVIASLRTIRGMIHQVGVSLFPIGSLYLPYISPYLHIFPVAKKPVPPGTPGTPPRFAEAVQ